MWFTRSGIALIMMWVGGGALAVGVSLQLLVALDSAQAGDDAFTAWVRAVGGRALTTCVDQAIVAPDDVLGHRATLSWAPPHNIVAKPASLQPCVDVFLADKRPPD